MFYVYGGGFYSGARNSTEYVYSSLGAYFARKGFITVIADYRLVPEVQYPDPVGDVCDAIAWISSNVAELVSPTTPNPDTDKFFLLGHSAGAIHVATLIFHPSILPLNSDIRKRVKGIVLMAGVYDVVTSLKDTLVAYYGSESIAQEQSPSALLERMTAESIAAMPKILLVEGQYEPRAQLETGKDFEQLLEKKQLPFKKIIAKGHNHISVYAALSSGQGEEWAAETAEWMHRIVNDVQL
jgi:acetyl esterase/lipase